jgi:hypothetical protein
MASVIQTLDKFNLDSLSAKPPRAMGKAKLVFLEPMVRVATTKLSQAWPIRPSDDSNEKFTLEVRLDDESETFTNALRNFDLKIRKLAYENRKSWFGKSADGIESESDLRQMHHLSIAKGSEKPDGSKYDDTVKFKITGWQNYVEEVLYKGEGDKKFPVDAKWKPRLVDAMGHGGPEDSQTKFFLSQGRDMATGKERVVPKVPCQDPAGNQMLDANGNTMWEFVGPKHCQPGSKLTIIFQPSMVWLAAKFGVTLAAKQVFITPPPPKSRNVVEGIEIVDVVDPILATRAVQLALAGDDLRDLEGLPTDCDSSSISETTESVQQPPPVEAQESPKKRSSAAASAPKTSKKSKTVNLDEEF